MVAHLRDSFGADATDYNFYISNDWKTRDAPSISVLAESSTESEPHMRTEEIRLSIEVKWPGANVPGESNNNAHWRDINHAVGIVMAALSLTDDECATYSASCAAITTAGRALATTGTEQDQEDNADMESFTCTYLQYLGAQRAASDGVNFWLVEIRNFLVRAVPMNVD